MSETGHASSAIRYATLESLLPQCQGATAWRIHRRQHRQVAGAGESASALGSFACDLAMRSAPDRF